MKNELENLSKQLGDLLKAKHCMLTVAESCTSGGLAQAITSVPGSSQWFERGFVTYSNLSKQELLGVNKETLAQYGAVSEEVAQEMAKGALSNSKVQCSIAITGIAGPDGGTAEKPVGTVWIAWMVEKNIWTKHLLFEGDRQAIRKQAVVVALEELVQFLNSNP